MLSRLWLDGFVGRNHQQHQIEAESPGQHIAHKAFVARDVDKANAQVLDLEEREANIEGDTAPLLFFQTIRMRARERLHERRLAVIDMAGGADNDISHTSAVRLRELMLQKSQGGIKFEAEV